MGRDWSPTAMRLHHTGLPHSRVSVSFLRGLHLEGPVLGNRTSR